MWFPQKQQKLCCTAFYCKSQESETLHMEKGWSMTLQVRPHSSQSQECKKDSPSSVSRNTSHVGNEVFPSKNLSITFKHVVDYQDLQGS